MFIYYGFMFGIGFGQARPGVGITCDVLPEYSLYPYIHDCVPAEYDLNICCVVHRLQAGIQLHESQEVCGCH